MLTEISEQAIITGFKNVMIMGDHGGGQPAVFAEVAKKLDAKYAPQGKHVYFVDEVYKKAQDDFDDWLVAHGYPRSSHAGIPDTSTMLYLGGDKGWVRKELIPTAEGDPVPPPGARGQGRGTPRSERAAAQEQRHLRRRAPLDRRARQAGVRHQGRLRGEADQRLPREPAEERRSNSSRSAGSQDSDCRKERSSRPPFLPHPQFCVHALSLVAVRATIVDAPRAVPATCRRARRAHAALRSRRDAPRPPSSALPSSTTSSARFLTPERRHASGADAVHLPAAEMDRRRSTRATASSRPPIARRCERCAPEALQARGPWALFEMRRHRRQPRTRPEDTEDAEQSSVFRQLPGTRRQPSVAELLATRSARERSPASACASVARRHRSIPNRAVAWLALASACREIARRRRRARARSIAPAALAPDWEAVAYESGKLWLVVRRPGARARRVSARRRSDADLLRRLQQSRRDARRARRAGGGAGGVRAGAGARSAQLHHSQQHRRRLPRAGTARRIGSGVPPRHRARARRSCSATTTSVTRCFSPASYADALAAYEEGQRRDPQQNRRQACRLAMMRLRDRRRRRRRARPLALRERARRPTSARICCSRPTRSRRRC